MNLKKISILLGVFASSLAMFAGTGSESPEIWEKIPSPLKKASWIWPYPISFCEIVNSYAQFREKFEIEDVPEKAPLYITADQCYRLYVNGEFVASGPARGFQKSWPYDEIDVAKYLKKGVNIIAVRAYNAGRSTFGYLTAGNAGVLYALDLGNGKIVASKVNTKSRRQSGCDRNTAIYSLQLNNQEHIDLREENPDWVKADFDDLKWGGSEGAKVFNAMPYYTLEERMIPMMESYIVPAPRLVLQGSGKCVDTSERVFNINELLAKEVCEHKPMSCATDFVEVPASKPGEYPSYIFDVGKMMVGFPMIKIEGAKGGEIIDMSHAEVLNGANLLDSHKTHCKVALSNRLICRAGNQEHQFFHIQGFRYVLVRVRNNASALKVYPMLRWSAYPLEDKGVFSTSDELVNKIWQACKHTQKICAIDSYVDTPWREQAQWWGDARVQSWNTFFISNDARLLRRGIRNIAMQTVPNGLTYGHAPTMAHTCILPDFSLTWIASIWDYYWQTGKSDAYTEHRDVVMGILSYFDSVTDDNGLVRYDPRYWLFMDWTDIQRDGNPTVLNMWLLYALDRMAELCNDCGFDDDAEIFAARASKVRRAITTRLLDSDGLVVDGIRNGKKNPSKSIHSQTLAKINNIEGFDFEKACVDILLPYIRDDKVFSKATPSSFWVVNVLKVMADAGYNREVYDFIKRRWAEMAEYGTTFENFDVSSGISHSHAWSAHPVFLLPQILGGIKQEAPAWRKISCNPNRFVDSATIVYPTPQGNVKVSWKKNSDGSFNQNIENPAY